MELGNLLTGVALNTVGLCTLITGATSENKESWQNFLNLLIFLIGVCGWGTLLGVPNGLTYNQTPASQYFNFASGFFIINLEKFGSIVGAGLDALQERRGKPVRKVRGRSHTGWAAAIFVPLLIAVWLLNGFVDHTIATMNDIHDYYNHTAYVMTQNQLDAVPIVQTVAVGTQFAIAFFLLCSLIAGSAKALAYLASVALTIFYGWWRFYIGMWVLGPTGATMDPTAVPTVAMVMVTVVLIVVAVLAAGISYRSFGKVEFNHFLPYPAE
jgi:hypothetical protein